MLSVGLAQEVTESGHILSSSQTESVNALATVKNGKPAVACYKHNVHQLPFKAPVDVLFWTLQSQGIN